MDEPARYVRFTEAMMCCRSLDRRLLTFEEWEWAAWVGRESPYPRNRDLSVAWAFNAGGAEQPVFSRAMSVEGGLLETALVMALSSGTGRWGIEGLVGNVSEWVTGPDGRNLEPPHFHRGGSFLNHPVFLNSHAYQFASDPCARYVNVGFRCARDLPDDIAEVPMDARD